MGLAGWVGCGEAGLELVRLVQAGAARIGKTRQYAERLGRRGGVGFGRVRNGSDWQVRLGLAERGETGRDEL